MKLHHIILLSQALTLSACHLITPSAPEETTLLDGPIEGLNPTQTHQFLRGDEEFARRLSFTEGLGPIFNATSCDSCHPGDGRGHRELGFMRFGRVGAQGGFDPMFALGGPQLQDRAAPGYLPESLPDTKDLRTSVFLAPAVTGLGLLEAVDDDTLLALADPDDANQDGISGRAHMIPTTPALDELAALADDGQGRRLKHHQGAYIGRFGRKATQINLLHQVISAYVNDMGMTSDFALRDPINPSVGIGDADAAPDPELGSEVIFAVNFYMRTLRPPPRRDPDDPTVKRGERIFSQLGCESCHTPTLTTGEAALGALSRVTFHPYTDLLLHDLGPELDDGYTEGAATSAEWRTTPLWGLGLATDAQGGQPRYLHDGRATTLTQAIELHGGEAQTSRANFRALKADERAALLRFLESL